MALRTRPGARRGVGTAGAVLVAAAATALLWGLPAARGQGLEAFEDSLTTLAEKATPFCVKVKVLRVRGTALRKAPCGKKLERVSFNDEVSLSGVLLDSEGHVATLGEALGGNAQRVSASIYDGKTERVFAATIIGRSKTCNVGLIRLESKEHFDAPVMADSDRLRPGSVVVGLSYPFDLGPAPSVSFGIVSAVHRSFRDKIARHDDLLEASFTIRPGETGGPLFNSSGEIAGTLLTGFNGIRQDGTLATGGSRFYRGAGITLAIPINTVLREVEKILDQQDGVAGVSEGEKAPWLGIIAEELDDEVLRNQVKLETGGVMIFHVYAGQPAAKADIRQHDILVRWNGELIRDFDHFNALIGAAGIGKDVDLVVIRNGEEHTKKLVIEKN